VALGAIPINDGQQDLVPALRTVDIARPEFRREAVALRVEDEKRVVAHGLEVTVVRGLLLRSVDGALGAVDVEDQPARGRARRGMLNELLVQASEPSVVSLLSEDLRLELMRNGRERDARVSALSRRQHPETSGLRPVARRRSCPRTQPSRSRSTDETDRRPETSPDPKITQAARR